MAQVSRATWGTSLTTLVNDNSAGEISAADVRSILNDLEDSVIWFDEAAATDVILLGERADHATTFPAAGQGEIWIRNDATQSLIFTDDAGFDGELLTLGAAVVTGDLLVVDANGRAIGETGEDVTLTGDAAVLVTAGAGGQTDGNLIEWDTAGNVIDTGIATNTLAVLGANTFTGTQDFNGQQVEGMLNKVITLAGAAPDVLTAADHSGNILITAGAVTVPATAGFNCILIAGGTHTITFAATGGNVSAPAMATGDIMTIVVQSDTVIQAVLTAAADKVSFI